MFQTKIAFVIFAAVHTPSPSVPCTNLQQKTITTLKKYLSSPVNVSLLAHELKTTLTSNLLTTFFLTTRFRSQVRKSTRWTLVCYNSQSALTDLDTVDSLLAKGGGFGPFDSPPI